MGDVILVVEDDLDTRTLIERARSLEKYSAVRDLGGLRIDRDRVKAYRIENGREIGTAD